MMKIFKRSLLAAGMVGVALSAAGCQSADSTGESASNKSLSVVFLPSDSAKEATAARTSVAKALSKATGKKVTVKTTTDYNVAVQAIASGKAQIAMMGAEGYIQAHKQSKDVVPIMTHSGKSGTLSYAQYRSYIMVPKDKAASYKVNGKYDIHKIKGKRMSFVSNTSTSGFAIPAGALQQTFKLKSKDDLSQNGKFFSKVLFGGSHQGSAVNLLKGDADVAAFDDTDLVQYGKFTNDASKVGADFKINKDAAAPFDAVRGKESIALAVYPVQNEPVVVNKKGVTQKEINKIVKVFTSKQVTNDKKFFAPADAKVRGMFTKDGDTRFIAISDKWYAPTHKILGE
ncbi:phosphate/phosphite/phosphonate ABC transporter substrate-binding protein [Secundilactobacillus paracollinoides]|uniref:phosphate/phosphite/phosphonate ABC transporter substrate-binding protein n=1 Tax=Secundilactobacillus paracollinoides TaxID=240427 RepID=UPI0006EF189E|nr:phosphate/phosphite/phosphonate ABC transporter substrate-binding protein [Secundilactobacillus paracollinoides]KRL80941.1 phosphate phosphite phosphonate ABC transporter, periplasmic binding protein [Secundilactobacillus paracollinoides DSM 15502 = JCM 11969]